MPGLEPGTSSLPRKCSTAELHWQNNVCLFFLERKTRLKLATLSLEGWCSINWATSATFVGEDGFEPPKVKTSRFTVCPIWPLWYSPLHKLLPSRLNAITAFSLSQNYRAPPRPFNFNATLSFFSNLSLSTFTSSLAFTRQSERFRSRFTDVILFGKLLVFF